MKLGSYNIYEVSKYVELENILILAVFRIPKSINLICLNVPTHSVLDRIWIKGSYLSQWLPQGERGPPKEPKSWWIEVIQIGAQFT